ncbi:MAG: FkbM family methyltransferase [Sulfitobacter sp.]
MNDTPLFEVRPTHDWLKPLDLRVVTHDPKADTPISSTLHHIGIWEEFMSRVVLDLLDQTPGRIVLYDVGSNIGWYALLTAAWLRSAGREGHVYAFEPSTSNQAILTQSLVRNDLGQSVTLVPAAVGAVTGQGQLTRVDQNFGNFRLHSDFNPVTEPARESEPIPVIALDTWRAEAGAPLPAFVKMDIQGSEPLALQGFASGLAACPELTIMLEWEPDIWPLEETLAPYGPFELFHLDDNNRLVRAVTEAQLLQDLPDWPRSYFDVIAVRGPQAVARMRAMLQRHALGVVRFTGGAKPLVERPGRISRVLQTGARALFDPGPQQSSTARSAKVVLSGRVFRLFGADTLTITAQTGAGTRLHQQTIPERGEVSIPLPTDQGPVSLLFSLGETVGAPNPDGKTIASISNLTLTKSEN